MATDEQNGGEAQVKRFAVGHYRVSVEGAATYGHVRRIGREWHANIHNNETGSVLRPAGKWDSKKAAVEECAWLIPRTPIVTRMGS